MINIIAIIPARMGSSRFPGKPMAKINNKPMIGCVYERVKQCELLTDVVVATCDNEIKDYIESIGGKAVMTSDRHDRASDRCAEALIYVEKEANLQYDIVVMVQGDEPMTESEMISEALEPMINDEKILVANLIGSIESVEEFHDKNCIKVVCDQKNNALYFSREPIPVYGEKWKELIKKQVCIIPFRREFLLQYNKMNPTPLEVAESVDMMRVLEYGYKVKMIPTSHRTHPVDTPEDLKKVESLMKEMLI